MKMKKKVVHYVYCMPGIPGGHLIACGIPLWTERDLIVEANFRKRKVTCKHCRKTRIFRGVK